MTLDADEGWAPVPADVRPGAVRPRARRAIPHPHTGSMRLTALGVAARPAPSTSAAAAPSEATPAPARSTARAGAAVHTVAFSGLTLPIAMTVAGICALLGAALDVAIGHAVVALFTAGFAGGCALAVLTVRRREMRRFVVGVPLVYLALLIIGGLLSEGTGMPLWLAGAFITKAPAVLIATTLATVCAIGRALRRPSAR